MYRKKDSGCFCTGSKKILVDYVQEINKIMVNHVQEVRFWLIMYMK